MEVSTSVAIEIASSKIKGAAASTSADGTVTVMAVEEVHAPNSVRHGRVQNVREVSAAVNEIIRKLENNPAVAPRKVQAVTLSLGGRTLAGTPATATLQFPRDIEVSEQTIRRLRNEAEKDFVASKNIEDTIARNYYVNNVQVSPVVGTVGSSLRGDFLMITCARENRQNLERLKYETIRSGNVDYRLRALALADAVLTDDDRQLGCALVDFGAETVTVSVYKNGSLAFLSTLPMGSRLITRDLMTGLTLTEAVAEDFKITLGNLGENSSDNPNAEEVNNYVRARAGEIAANTVNQINISGIDPQALGAGIVLTGGGARLTGYDALLSAQSHLTVRHGTLPPHVHFADNRLATTANIDVVALLLAADRDNQGLTPLPEPEITQTQDADQAAPAEAIAIEKQKEPEMPEEPDVEDEEDDNDVYYTPERHAAPHPDKRGTFAGDDQDLLKDDVDADDYDYDNYTDGKKPNNGGVNGNSSTESGDSLLNKLRDRLARIFQPDEDVD